MTLLGDQMTEIRMDEKYSSFLKSRDVNRREGETEPAIRQKTFLTKDFLNRVKRQSRFTSFGEILPQNCRVYKPLSSKVAVLVVEDTPRIRTISVNINMEAPLARLKKTGKLIEYGFRDFLKKNKMPYQFTLSFPYVVYIAALHGFGRKIYVDSFQVYYRLSPVTSLSDYLLLTNLPNTDRNQYICLGGGGSDYGSLFSSFNQGLERFWVNTFNSDYSYNYKRYENVPEICDFLNWFYNTNRDPLFVFDVPWVKSKRTLGEVIKTLEKDYDEGEVRLDYSSLSKIFTVPSEPEEIQEEGGDPIREGICDSIYLMERELSVGEKVQLEGKEFYVYSFMGRDSKRPISMQLEDKEGNLSQIELKEELMISLDKQLDKTEFLDSIKLSDKQVVKVGDVVLVDFPHKMYKKVEKIRVARDGLVEVRLLGEYYIAKNLQAKFIDLAKFEFNSVQLTRGKNYLLTSDPRGFPCSCYEEVKFKEAEPSPVGKIVLKFEYIESKKTFALDASRTKSDILSRKDLSSIKVFRVGRKLYTNESKSVLLSEKGVFFPRSAEGQRLTFNSELAKSEIIKDNEINITGFDLDINFKVGEKVVVSNWNDLPQMLKVWTITGFKLSGNLLQLELQHKQEQISVTYIDFGAGQVEVGLIRKVVNEFGGVKVGIKIRAKEAGISNFPKKDVNIIVAFIVDTGGPPLVLCSNCCTLWMFDLIEKFELVPVESVLWKGLEHAPINLDRIRVQNGDMFEYRSDFNNRLVHYMCVSNYDSRRALFRIEDYSAIVTYFGFDRCSPDRTSSRYGFITPRYTEAQMLNLTRKKMFPNFHGLYTEVPESYLIFLVDRRLLNVQSSY